MHFGANVGYGIGWGNELSLHENSGSHSQSLRGFEVEVRGFKIFEAFLSNKKLFCLKKYRSVKQQFSSWFFLIFLQAPFFRISN